MVGLLAIQAATSRASKSPQINSTLDLEGEWDQWLNWDDTDSGDWGDSRDDIPSDAPGS